MTKFKKIYIEITNRCNLACSYCLRSKRPKACMSPDDFASILLRIKAHTQHIALHVLGEPLLHPELDQLLALCHRHDLAVNLTTNATLLPQHQTMLLASPALRQVNISLHSALDRPAAPVFNDYLPGIFAFIRQARSASRPFISLRLWNMSHNGSGHSQRQNEAILRELTDFFGLPQQLANELTPGQGITLAPRVFLSQSPRFTWPHDPAPEVATEGFCRGLRDHVAILVDGTVVPCCLDAEADIRLGNIHTHPLAEILATPRAIRLHEGFSRRQLVEPLCRRCTFRQSF